MEGGLAQEKKCQRSSHLGRASFSTSTSLYLSQFCLILHFTISCSPFFPFHGFVFCHFPSHSFTPLTFFSHFILCRVCGAPCREGTCSHYLPLPLPTSDLGATSLFSTENSAAAGEPVHAVVLTSYLLVGLQGLFGSQLHMTVVH